MFILKIARRILLKIARVFRLIPLEKEAYPPHNLWPHDAVFLSYDEKAQQQRFDRLYVLLSFDCDTPDDIPAARKVFDWMRERGLKATFAVPGAMLKQGAEVYRRLYEDGADFINHGAAPHAEWRDGRYWPATFYDKLLPDQVVADIEDGDSIFRDILGGIPVGFRAPHFGSFQSLEQIGLMHAALERLGYQYSSSTLPEAALNHGPVMDLGTGILEIPCFGSYDLPTVILDSWNYIESPYNPVVQPRYAELFIRTVDRLLALDIHGVLNYYIDPAHVDSMAAFYEALDYLIEREVPSLHFADVINIFNGVT
jgi:peptidoglycan/xylan/chitin deacetylase (PgdA/CDA1 family)